MLPRRRLRTFTLWTGTTLCVLIAGAFVVSGWWLLAVQVPTGYGPAVTASGGAFGVLLEEQWSEAFVLENRTVQPWGCSGPDWWFWNYWEVDGRRIAVPLYAAFAAVAIPTLLAWRYWPKPVKPGHCRCG